MAKGRDGCRPRASGEALGQERVTFKPQRPAAAWSVASAQARSGESVRTDRLGCGVGG